MYVMDQALGRRIEAAEARFYREYVELLAQLPGNPYGCATAVFGDVVALVARRFPGYTLWNRVMCSAPGAEADLDRGIALLREHGVPLRVDVTPFHQNSAWWRHLAGLGLRPLGFEMVTYREAFPVSGATGAVDVRPVVTDAEIEAAGLIQAEAFGAKDDAVPFLVDMVRVTMGRPEWTNYLAWLDGEPAGMAVLHVADGVGSLASAGTLERFRGRGAQTALLRRRIADAIAAGCDLIVSQTASGSISQHNMERAGMRIAYSKAEVYGT